MSKTHRLEFRIDNKLLIALKEIKANYNFETYEDLLDYLCKKINRPENYQDNYKHVYGNLHNHKLDIRLSEQTLIKFNTFAAVFKKQIDVLDFLVDQEKTGRYNVVKF